MIEGQWQTTGFVQAKEWERAHYFLGSKCDSLCKGACRLTYLSVPSVEGKTKCKACARLLTKLLSMRIVHRLPVIRH